MNRAVCCRAGVRTASATGPEGEEAFVAASCVVPAASRVAVPAAPSAGEGDRCAPAALASVGSGSRVVVGLDVATVDAASSSSSAASVEGERDEGSVEEKLEEEEDDRVSWVTSAASPRVSRSSAASIVARVCRFSSSAS